MPRVYLVPDPTPNAFATGRDPQHAAVAVNQGLLEILNEEELVSDDKVLKTRILISQVCGKSEDAAGRAWPMKLGAVQWVG